jgi:hypothetical protein
VKLRTKAAGQDYEKFNDGNPISVTEWFAMTCYYDLHHPCCAEIFQSVRTKDEDKKQQRFDLFKEHVKYSRNFRPRSV